jgi:hypothetical protein
VQAGTENRCAGQQLRHFCALKAAKRQNPSQYRPKAGVSIDTPAFKIKKPGNIPGKRKITIDKHLAMLYNGVQYCDNMPRCALLPTLRILSQSMAVVKYEVLKK